MIIVFLMFCPIEGAPELKSIKRVHVLYFDKGGLVLFKMKRVMKVIQMWPLTNKSS